MATLCEDNDGGIWIGTDGGLSHFKDGRFTNYTVRAAWRTTRSARSTPTATAAC